MIQTLAANDPMSVRRRPRIRRSTTPHGSLRVEASVVHHFILLFGREFELVIYRHTGARSSVFPRPRPVVWPRWPAHWTSAVGEDPFRVIAAGRSHFRLEDLREMVVMEGLHSGSQKEL